MPDARNLSEWQSFLSYAKDFAEDNGAKFKLEIDVPGKREKATITKYFVKGERK